MADSKKDLSMEMRLLLALVLMLAVLFGTPYFYKAVNPPPPATATKETAPTPTPAKKSAPAETRAASVSKEAPPAEAIPAISAQSVVTTTIDTALYRVTFSNHGGVVTSWLLKNYKDSAQKKELELVNPAAAPKTGYPFSLTFKNQKPPVDLNTALFAMKKSADGLGIDFEFANGAVSSKKSFRFTKDTYLSQVSSEVTGKGVPVPHQLTWRGGFGDLAVESAAATHRAIYFDVPAGKLIQDEAKVAKDAPVTRSGTYSFAGLSDTYFAAVFLPPGNGATEIQIFDDKTITPFNKEEAEFVGAAVGGDGRNNFSLFVGPKDIDILTQVNPKLAQAVDFGFFGFLAKPLFLITRWINDQYINNYGWSIILITVFLNFAMFPLKLSSLKSMKKMSALQPQIAAINDKYKGLSMRDPKKQQQNQEIMALYQKNGVNPLAGGCVPLLLQMPFLFAFYTVFQIAIEMRGARWLWVADLSQPETLAIRLLPIAMIVSQFIMQKMTPMTPGTDPAQQKVMQFMPVIFGFMFYGASSGLMLYWLTGNLIAIAQQWFFNKTSTAADVAQSVQPKKRNGRK